MDEALIYEILISMGLGILGAFARVLIVMLKCWQLNIKLNLGFALYSLVAIVIGAFCGIVLGYGAVLSFLAGYAGLDLIEGIYNVFKRKKITFEK